MPRLPSAVQMILLCSCGFGTDDPDMMDDHAEDYPGHDERFRWWNLLLYALATL